MERKVPDENVDVTAKVRRFVKTASGRALSFPGATSWRDWEASIKASVMASTILQHDEHSICAQNKTGCGHN
jgi:hypothetical protein